MTKDYIRIAFLLYCIFSLSFGEGRGEVSAQQLSPQYIRMKRWDTDGVRKGDLVPTNRAGQMVGFGNLDAIIPPNLPVQYPYLYRLDSNGKYTSKIRYEFATQNKIDGFDHVIPYKDSLYIFGTVYMDEGNSGELSSNNNMFILKTDSAGKIAWSSKFGNLKTDQFSSDRVVCADGGIAFCGTSDGHNYYKGKLQDSTGNPDNWYIEEMAFIAKYDANGKVIINKTFQLPYGQNKAQGVINFNALAETPDQGFIIAGEADPDYRKYSTVDNTTTGLRDADLFLMKIDKNGNKLWDKKLVYDSKDQDNKTISVIDIIPHPDGGYIMVGQARISEWTADGTGNDFRYVGTNGTKKYDVNNYIGGLVMKISEAGDIEWIKSFHFPLPFQNYPSDQPKGSQVLRFNNISLSYTSGVPTGFIISGSDFYVLKNTMLPTGQYYYIGQNDPRWIQQNLIVKTDLNGNLLWDREYGSLETGLDMSAGAYLPIASVYEEPGGSLLLNSFASTPITFNPSIYPPLKSEDLGILRLTDKGYLTDPACSISPKLEVYTDDNLFTFWNNIASDYSSIRIRSLPTAVIIDKQVPLGVTYEICGNTIIADFDYTASCTPSNTGASVEFTNASFGASYFHYDFGDSSSNDKVSDLANPQHLYSTAGTYTVSLTIKDGDNSKTKTIEKIITVPGKRTISLFPGNTTICQGASLNLTSTISSGNFPDCAFLVKIDTLPYYYGVDAYASSFTDTTFNSLPFTSANSLLFFIGTDQTHCLMSDTAYVKILPAVNMSLRGENTTLCFGDSALLIASGSSTYLWNPGNTTNDSLKVYPLSTKTYTISSGQSTTVCGTDTASIKIIVNQNPLVNISTEQTIYPGQQVRLLVSGGITYIWSPAAGLNSISTNNPIAEPTLTTMYFVKVTDANGCVGTDSVIVNLKTCGVDMFVPNAFSPNDDNQNDVFYLKTLNNDCIQSITFKIFDRWGNKVFESSDINIGWNGVYNGKAMDANVFVYFLNATLETGEIITQKGNISLLR